ncbi:MAG: hypothetical protein ACO2PM_26305 [Pyrobaculum sp.]
MGKDGSSPLPYTALAIQPLHPVWRRASNMARLAKRSPSQATVRHLALKRARPRQGVMR